MIDTTIILVTHLMLGFAVWRYLALDAQDNQKKNKDQDPGREDG